MEPSTQSLPYTVLSCAMSLDGYLDDASGKRLVLSNAADLDRVRVRSEGRLVAEHPRIWARCTTLTDPAHLEMAGWLRKQFQQPRAAAGDDLARDLSDYDRAFGLSTEVGTY